MLVIAGAFATVAAMLNFAFLKVYRKRNTVHVQVTLVYICS